MPPLKPQPGLKKSVKVTTIPPSRKRRKSFFEEYYYGILALEFLFVALLFSAGGLGFYNGTLVGMLVTAATAVAWQFRQFERFKKEPVPRPVINPELKPIRPAKRAPVPVGPDGKKKFPPSYFPPLRDRKPQQ